MIRFVISRTETAAVDDIMLWTDVSVYQHPSSDDANKVFVSISVLSMAVGWNLAKSSTDIHIATVASASLPFLSFTSLCFASSFK